MTAQRGYGASIAIGSTPLSGTPTYTVIADVKKIGDFEVEAIIADVTNHQSPGGFREYFPTGLMDTGELEIEISYDDANEATHQNTAGGLTYALLNRSLLAYQMIFADEGATQWNFDAYVSKIGHTIELEQELVQKITLRPTGQPAIT